MMSTTIRIDPDTYRRLLEAKAKLEHATGKVQSFNTTVAFLLTLQGNSDKKNIGKAIAQVTGCLTTTN
jgi:hypothetical protein